MKDINIKIVITDAKTGEELCKAESMLFSTAEMELVRMEAFIKRQEAMKELEANK
jgi:hypothetical protein